MNAHDQVMFLLNVALYIAPVGVYFLTLGLMSTQPKPLMLGGRADFVQLGVVFFPLVVAVVARLFALSGWGLALLGAIAVAGLWLFLLPKPGRSWVFYNLSQKRFTRMLEHSARRLGLDLSAEDGAWRLGGEVMLRTAALGLLRTVSLTCDWSSPAGRKISAQVTQDLAEQCQRQQSWPGLVGAGLVVVGCTILGIPMLLAAGHLPAVAEVVRRFFG